MSPKGPNPHEIPMFWILDLTIHFPGYQPEWVDVFLLIFINADSVLLRSGTIVTHILL
jgi:hypothetical protein